MSQTKPTFEDALARLEEIARQLENGEAPLETAMGLYEEGVRLAADCNARLEAARQRVTRLKPDRQEDAE